MVLILKTSLVPLGVNSICFAGHTPLDLNIPVCNSDLSLALLITYELGAVISIR